MPSKKEDNTESKKWFGRKKSSSSSKTSSDSKPGASRLAKMLVHPETEAGMKAQFDKVDRYHENRLDREGWEKLVSLWKDKIGLRGDVRNFVDRAFQRCGQIAYMNWDEFQTIVLGDVAGKPRLVKLFIDPDQEEYMRKVFSDQERGRGSLDRPELVIAMKTIAKHYQLHGDVEAFVYRAFQIADDDRDFRVSFDDFKRVLINPPGKKFNKTYDDLEFRSDVISLLSSGVIPDTPKAREPEPEPVAPVVNEKQEKLRQEQERQVKAMAEARAEAERMMNEAAAQREQQEQEAREIAAEKARQLEALQVAAAARLLAEDEAKSHVAQTLEDDAAIAAAKAREEAAKQAAAEAERVLAAAKAKEEELRKQAEEARLKLDKLAELEAAEADRAAQRRAEREAEERKDEAARQKAREDRARQQQQEEREAERKRHEEEEEARKRAGQFKSPETPRRQGQAQEANSNAPNQEESETDRLLRLATGTGGKKWQPKISGTSPPVARKTAPAPSQAPKATAASPPTPRDKPVKSSVESVDTTDPVLAALRTKGHQPDLEASPAQPNPPPPSAVVSDEPRAIGIRPSYADTDESAQEKALQAKVMARSKPGPVYTAEDMAERKRVLEERAKARNAN